MKLRDLISELRSARKQARALEQHFDRLLEAAEAANDNTGDWIDQSKSSLGPRRHCAAVRRRLKDELPGAAIVGRSYRLSLDAYAEEQGLRGGSRLSRCKAVTNEAEEEAAYRALLERLGN